MRSRRASTRRRARPRPHRRALPLVAMAAVLAGVSLASCARTVIVEPAQDAADPECADIMLTLPDEIAGEQARRTSSQGTKAWGDPSIAVLRCGVTPPGPTTDRWQIGRASCRERGKVSEVAGAVESRNVALRRRHDSRRKA